MRRPFLGVVIGYALGVCLGEWFQPPLVLLLSTTALWLAAFWFLPRLRPVFLAAALLGCGWFNRVRQSAILSPDDLRRLIGANPALAQISGRLVRSPDVRVVNHSQDSTRAEAWRSRVPVDVDRVCLDHVWRLAHGRVWAEVPDRLGRGFYGGKCVRITGVLKPPESAVAPGLFDQRAYLRRRGMDYVLVTDSLSDWQVGGSAGSDALPWADRFGSWARSILARGLPADDPAVQLRWAMLLGWRRGMTEELRTPFLRSGSLHVFAISGLHVTLVAGILVAALRLLRVPRGWSGAVVIPALWLYAGATGWQPSAVRATVMMSVVVAGWALRRPSDLLNSLAAAAWLLLLWDPQQLFRAGFQLSFGVVLSLAVWLPVLERCHDRWLGAEPWLPRSRQGRGTKRFRTVVRRAYYLMAVALAAWVGSLPLAAWYFHLVTPVSPFASLAIVPLSGVVVLSGLCSLVCGGWWCWAADCFNHVGWAAMHLMMYVSAVAAELPGAWFPVARPSPFFLVGYFALLLWPLGGRCRARWRMGWAVVAIMTLSWGWWGSRRPAQAMAEVVVLPVGGGDSLWVDLPGWEQDRLLDTGDARAVRWVVGPFLAARGVSVVPSLVLTHGDARHVEGVSTLLEALRVDRVWISPLKARSPVYKHALEMLESRRVVRGEWARGMQLGGVRVLHPERDDSFTRADDQAVVVLLTWGGTKVLLCSDLGRQGQDRLLERERRLRVDVLVAGMPSDGEPLKDALLQALRPRAIVISSGRFPASEQPSRALRLRLARCGVPVIFTADQGAVAVRVDGAGARVRAMDGTVFWLPAVAAGVGED